jgi:hypothetical protein
MGDGAVTYFKNRLMKIKGQLPKKNQIDKIDMKALLKDLGLKYNPEAARRALHKLVG